MAKKTTVTKANIAPDLRQLSLPIDGFKLDPENAREHGEEDVAAIAASLAEHGQQKPIVYRDDGTIVAGNGTWLAAKRLGWDEIAASRWVGSGLKARAYGLADNRTAELSSWNEDMRRANIEILDKQAPELLASTAFSTSEINDILGRTKITETSVPEPERSEPALPEPPAKPETEPGDVWILDSGGGVCHRLLCADSTMTENLDRLLGERRAEMVFTDPPYAIYGSSTGIQASIVDDKMVRSFFRDILALCVSRTAAFGHIYVCCDWRSWASWWEVSKVVGIAPKNMIVWDKGSTGLGFMYLNAHELIFFGSNRPPQTMMKATEKVSGEHGVQDSNVWSYPRVQGEEREHNAQKPVDLVARAIRNSSSPGGTVLDPFMGSGTTIIAAQRSGRSAFGLEVEPKWCDVTVRRWERETGKKAERRKST